MAKIVTMAMVNNNMPRQPQAEQHYRDQLAGFLRDAGWRVKSYPEAPPEVDFLINKDGLAYLVELKRSPESRRDRLVPLLSEAILQAKAHSQQLQAQPLAVVASHSLSPAAVEQVLSFAEDYAHDVGIGLFDDYGIRVFRGPGLQDLNSSSPAASHERRQLPKSRSYSVFSDLGQWMLKVLLAPDIDPRFLRAPRGSIRNASDLAFAARVSQMSASRLVRQLVAENFLDSNGPNLRLVRLHDLFEEWQSASRRSFKEIPCRWIIPGHGEMQLQSELRSYSANLSPEAHAPSHNSPRVCLGLFSAASALGVGFVRGVPPVIYMERLDALLLERLGISSQSSDRADVHVRIPVFKESIFRGAVEIDGLPVSDAVQIWLDVSSHPSRGKEQAEHLRRETFGSLLQE